MRKTLNKFIRESILDSEFDSISIYQTIYKVAADLNKKLLDNYQHDECDALGNKLNNGDVVICAPEAWHGYNQKKAAWAGGVNHINIGIIVDYKKDGNYIVRDPVEAFKYGIDPDDPRCHDQTIMTLHGIIKLDKKTLVNLLK